MRTIAPAVQTALCGTPRHDAFNFGHAGPAIERTRALHLTPRELEVLALLGAGLPNKSIGRKLDISVSTVKCHIANILSELGVSTRLQAVVVALRDGLIPEDPEDDGTGPVPPAATPRRLNRALAAA